MSRSRSECTFHVKIWRNSDSQLDVRGACHCSAGLRDKRIRKVVEGRIEEELKGTAKAHAATRRMKEYQDRAAEKGTKRMKTDQEEEERQEREHGGSTDRMEEEAPTSSSSGSGDVAPAQSSSSSSSAMKTSGIEGGDGCKEAIKKRKAEEEHPEDPERDDGKWMRTDGNKRKAAEESEESRLRKTVRYLKGVGQDGKQEGVRQNARGRGGGGS